MQYYRLILEISRKLVYRKLRISHFIAFTRYNSAKKLWNLLKCNGERLAGKTSLSSRPYLINSEPTNACILHCPFCPTGKSNSRKNGYADPKIFENVIHELAPYTYLITFHGWGEPLLHKDLPRLIDLAHRQRICTVVTTNGLLLNKGIIEKLICSKLDVLYISIDGASEETYRMYRIGGSLKKLLSNIETLVALKKERKSTIPFIEWQFIVFRHNEHEIKKAKELARKLGVDSIVFLPAYTEDKAYEPSDPKFRLPLFSPLTKPSDCKHLWSTLSMHWDGIVVPCCNDYEGNTAYGNARQFNIREIWNNTKYKASRSMVTSGIASEREQIPCTNCINNIV
jgi:MoaA/NifB/PqqE/SkfB family radical SAM enzyme